MLFMVDGTTTDAVDPAEIWPDFIARLPAKLLITVVRNKADVTGETLGISDEWSPLIRLSAPHRRGRCHDLRNHLKQSMGFDTSMEGGFPARRRHLQALEEAARHLEQGKAQLIGAWAGNCWRRVAPGAAESGVRSPGVYVGRSAWGFSSFCW